ncbi:MAG: hypothetical protein ACM3VT_14165 [Solirubrobacterales bacterium]
MRTTPITLILSTVAIAAIGCQTGGPQVRISKEHAGQLNLQLSGGVAADNSGYVYLATSTTVMRYRPGPNKMESLLIDSCSDIRDVAVTPEGVALILRQRELSACVAGYLVSVCGLPEDAIAISCSREFAYVLTARGSGARLLRIHLTGDNKGLQQTLLTTEDRPQALCAVRGGCLVASGGNVVKVSDPVPTAENPDGEIATVLLAAIQEPVASVVADEKKLIVYFATADMTYAWIQGQILPVFPAGSRLAWAKDTLTICQPSDPGSQMIQIPAAGKYTSDLLKKLDKSSLGK